MEEPWDLIRREIEEHVPIHLLYRPELHHRPTAIH